MVKLINETEFPGGDIVQIYEIDGKKFQFGTKVNVREVEFPNGEIVFYIDPVKKGN